MIYDANFRFRVRRKCIPLFHSPRKPKSVMRHEMVCKESQPKPSSFKQVMRELLRWKLSSSPGIPWNLMSLTFTSEFPSPLMIRFKWDGTNPVPSDLGAVANLNLHLTSLMWDISGRRETLDQNRCEVSMWLVLLEFYKSCTYPSRICNLSGKA